MSERGDPSAYADGLDYYGIRAGDPQTSVGISPDNSTLF
jgi:hypothetical protein